jgi:Putative DNA-binding domain
MPTNAERLYDRLKTATAIRGLIGQTEDADFDCKEWSPDPSARRSIGKAACGFTNATGGVIVVGMMAKGGPDGVDVVKEEKPVDDVEAVRSQVEDAISKIVEPGIEGVRSRAVPLTSRPKSKKGFVVVFIPESESSPHRSTASKEFYVRIGPQTLPMAYFQIEDRFGRRPHPRLVVDIRDKHIRTPPLQAGIRERVLSLIVTNTGRGIARFPSVRFKRTHTVSPPSITFEQVLWSLSNAIPEWTSFRGGANDVVYPGESLFVTELVQHKHPVTTQIFPALTIVAEAVCDGMPPHRQSFEIPAFSEEPGIIGSIPATRTT